MQEEKCLKVCTHVHVIIENNFTSRCLNLVLSAQTALIPNICESHSQDGLATAPPTRNYCSSIVSIFHCSILRNNHQYNSCNICLHNEAPQQKLLQLLAQYS